MQSFKIVLDELRGIMPCFLQACRRSMLGSPFWALRTSAVYAEGPGRRWWHGWDGDASLGSSLDLSMVMAAVDAARGREGVPQRASTPEVAGRAEQKAA